ncbi:MAG: hypothetical protein N3B21_09140 [Clostridia bacterium]|nr:hypothetical protein [Clostridia bacterium]
MNTFLTLLKTSLNVNFGISALRHRFIKQKRRLWEPVLIGVSFAFGIGTLMALTSAFFIALLIAGKSMGQPEIVLAMGFVSAQLIILMFGIFYIMGAFYFSKDIDILVPLPLKPSHIIASKFVIVMINEYLTLVPILLPAVIIYGAGTGQGILYWIKALILWLATPVIPLAMAGLFVVILMRFVNIRKSKDLLAFVGGFLGVIVAVGTNFFFQRMPKGKEEEFIQNFLNTQSGLVKTVGQKFPPALWATKGLAENSPEAIGYFLLFIGTCLVLLAALLWLANRIFFKSLLSGQEVNRRRRSVSQREMDGKYGKRQSPVLALFWKEWKLFFRTPIYVMNGLVGMVMAPFLIIMPYIANKEAGAYMFDIISNPQYTVPVTLAGVGVLLLVTNMNIVANTSVSREGNMFWVSKLIPVPAKQQILAKVLHSIAIVLIGIVVTAIVLAVILKYTPIRIIIIVFLAIIGSFSTVALNLMVDVLRPKLEWTNPQEAVKRNINAILGMLASFVALGIFAGVAAMMVFMGAPEWLVYTGLAVIMGAVAAAALFGLLKLSEWKYKKIEV